MKYYRCVREKTEDNDYCVIYFNGKTYEVGFAQPDSDFESNLENGWHRETCISEDNCLFDKVNFTKYEEFYTDEDATRSIIEGGYPFGTRNAIPHNEN